MKISLTVLMLQGDHEYVAEMAISNLQREKTPKVCNPKLRFLNSGRRLIVLNICVKSHENIFNSFEVTERTRVCGKNCHFQCSKSNNSDMMQSRVMVPALCTSTNPPLLLYKVS